MITRAIKIFDAKTVALAVEILFTLLKKQGDKIDVLERRLYELDGRMEGDCK